MSSRYAPAQCNGWDNAQVHFKGQDMRFLLFTTVVALSFLGYENWLGAAVSFTWATVGNPNNPPNPVDGDPFSPGIQRFGAVSYTFRIAKHEVTNAQYADFLNAVATTSDTYELFNTEMEGDFRRGGINRNGVSGAYSYSTKPNMADKPVNYVSFFDAMRFVNWLHNGQGNGSTEHGVYSIADGVSEVRADDVRYFLPSVDEWYKAAFHQPAEQGGDADDYWRYPTASNTTPTIATATSSGDIANPGRNVANYANGAGWNATGLHGNVTTVGSAGPESSSFYGTFDQGGNVWEWNDTIIGNNQDRGIRGGAWNFDEFEMSELNGGGGNPVAFEFDNRGFRVASPIPEPVSAIIFSTFCVLLCGLRKNRGTLDQTTYE